MMVTIKQSAHDSDEDMQFVKYVFQEGMRVVNCPQDNCKECTHRWGCLALKNAIEYLKRK